jgi:hypothetical protein
MERIGRPSLHAFARAGSGPAPRRKLTATSTCARHRVGTPRVCALAHGPAADTSAAAATVATVRRVRVIPMMNKAQADRLWIRDDRPVGSSFSGTG